MDFAEFVTDVRITGVSVADSVLCVFMMYRRKYARVAKRKDIVFMGVSTLFVTNVQPLSVATKP
jgi:hypothetical protein